jgi:multisubunit Na+/H+ antiporter MnhB subunit
MVSWTLPAVTVLVVVVGLIIIAATIALKRKEQRSVDYYSLFIIGVIWLVVGLALFNHALWIIGLVIAVFGLYHRNDWQRNRRKSWHKITDMEMLIITAGLMVIIAILVVGLSIFATYG